MKGLFNNELEQSTIGYMIESSKCREYGLLHLKPDCYNNATYRKVFEFIKDYNSEMFEMDTIDIIHLFDKMNKEIPISFLDTALNTTVSAEYFPAQCTALIDLHKRREIIIACEEAIKYTYEVNKIEDVKTQCEKLILDATLNTEKYKYLSMEELGEHSIERLKKQIEGYKGIETGFKDLDNKLGWFDNGTLIVIGGRTGMGKSMMITNMALNIAKAGYSIGVFNLEMTEDQLHSRFICCDSQFDYYKYTKNYKEINHLDGIKLETSRQEINKLNIFTSMYNRDISSMISEIKLMKRQHKIDIVFIDHLGLIKNTMKYNNRNIEIGDITIRLKMLAKQLDIPIVLICQINRGVENRTDCIPYMSDLRDSGNIEQDADIVMLLYREDYYNDGTDPKRPLEKRNTLEILIEKNRSGKCGAVDLLFRPEISRIDNIDKHSDNLKEF